VPLRSYGVLTATIERRTRASTRSDHYRLRCTGSWEVAINAHSDVPPSDVEFAVVTVKARRLNLGWRPLRPGEGLDYIRGNMVKPEQFEALPISQAGADNDLNELFDRHLTVGAMVQAFGARYNGAAKGVHDVHQNQGNIPRYREDDGVWQDGGLIIGTTAILLRFQSQSWTTDDRTGHAR
jgi:uncharacterized protein YukJ